MALMCHCFIFTSCKSDNTGSELQVPPAYKPGVTPAAKDLEDSNLLLSRGQKYYEDSKMQPALFEYLRAAELNPASYEAYFYIARICKKMGRTEQALESYDIALKLSPDSEEALLEYADLLRLSGNNLKASEVYAKILAAKPAEMAILLNYASSLARSGKFAEAETAFMKAVDSYPGDVTPLQSFARYQFERADASVKDAPDCYEKAAELYKKSSQITNIDSERWSFKFRQAQSLYRKWLVTKSKSDQKRASMIFDEYENSQEELPWKMSAQYFLSVLNEQD
jgi:tetratricopeptide (TPR) repeat protein